ncbi:MAG: ATP-binding cassette domain-containing protein [Desulfomicrobium escambiense]|nr:ATP-binding cassette domain-containing protein [Desulfomicrobium escambiense]
MITGFYQPSEGQVLLRGPGHHRHPAPPGVPQRHRPHLPEHPALRQRDGAGKRHDRRPPAPEDRLVAGGALPARPTGARSAAVAERARELLEVVGLEELAGEKANSLPYGAQRRLEIARALATRPTFLLLDEPAAGMNPNETVELMGFIRDIRTRFDLTILLIEHDMKVVMGICEHIWVLDYGETIAAGPPEAIQSDPKVIKAYLGEEAVPNA